MWPNPQENVDLVIFTETILHEKQFFMIIFFVQYKKNEWQVQFHHAVRFIFTIIKIDQCDTSLLLKLCGFFMAVLFSLLMTSETILFTSCNLR